MTLNDIDAVVFLEKAIFGETLGHEMIEKEITIHDFAHYYVYEYKRKIIGYIGLWINDDIGQVVNFLIKEGYQRQGFGKKLMTHAMNVFKSHEVSVISLEVRETNQAAILFYEGFGFEMSYKRKHYYGPVDALVLIWRDRYDHISSRE